MPTELITEHHHAHGPANRGRRVLRTAAPLFVRFPDTAPRAAAVVLHDIHGLTAPVEDMCRMLARCGYVAVAPFMYYENGGREFRPENAGTAEAAMALLRAEDLAADVAGALGYLRERVGVPSRSTGVLGIGMGGHLATWAAAEHEFAAAAAFEPRGLEEAPWAGAPAVGRALERLRTPWLGLAASEDPLFGFRDRAGELGDVVVPPRDGELGWWDEAVRFIDARVG
ncbi:Dienelactone hydrolase family protein [Saccharopolyspora antimicrobica]|uniref:Dienelactone hydrolase family protein n=1 Tax=Saccharopolyspora antimicrobica TaxID=455193 RepID=A0A1I4VZZ0_9PSEU|nr:dienelactone hydrolase family protein [Saccharopolyspora antimicrobica]RKT87139.1 dienelactone hydrolase family protein [Saccharopolyspora antimicrobica]SFN06725.1 Dienelactone hydrolase family protein [Saccharopolyspora antimicrobica]